MSAPATEAPKPYPFVLDKKNPLVVANTTEKLDNALLDLANQPPVDLVKNLCQLTANPRAQDVKILGRGISLLDSALKNDEALGNTPEFIGAFDTFSELVPKVIRAACKNGTFEFDDQLMNLRDFVDRPSTRDGAIGMLGTIMQNLATSTVDDYLSMYNRLLPLEAYARSVAPLARNPRLATHPTLVDSALFGLKDRLGQQNGHRDPQGILTESAQMAVTDFFISHGATLPQHRYDDDHQLVNHVLAPYFYLINKYPEVGKASLGFYQGMVEATKSSARHQLFVESVLYPLGTLPAEPAVRLLTQAVRSGTNGQIKDEAMKIFDNLRDSIVLTKHAGGVVEHQPVEEFFRAMRDKQASFIFDEEMLTARTGEFIEQKENADLAKAALPLVRDLSKRVASYKNWENIIDSAIHSYDLESTLQVMADAMENKRLAPPVKDGKDIRFIRDKLNSAIMKDKLKRAEGLSAGEKLELKRLYTNVALHIADPALQPTNAAEREQMEDKRKMLGLLYDDMPETRSILAGALQDLNRKEKDPQKLLTILSHLDLAAPEFVMQAVEGLEENQAIKGNDALSAQIAHASLKALNEAYSETTPPIRPLLLPRRVIFPDTAHIDAFYGTLDVLCERARRSMSADKIVAELPYLMSLDQVADRERFLAREEQVVNVFTSRGMNILKTLFNTSTENAFTSMANALSKDFHFRALGDENQMRATSLVISNPLSKQVANTQACLQFIRVIEEVGRIYDDEDSFIRIMTASGKNTDLAFCAKFAGDLEQFVKQNSHLSKAKGDVEKISARWQKINKLV